MQDTARRNGLRLVAGAISAAAWIGVVWASDSALATPGRTGIDDVGDVVRALAPFLVPGILAGLAGWWRDPIAALMILLGGIAGAVIVAWAAGVPEVEPGADPAMREAYRMMVIVVAGVISVVLGSIVVTIGFWIGRIARRTFGDTP